MGAAAAWAVCEVAVLSGPGSDDWAPLVYTALESGGLGAGTLTQAASQTPPGPQVGGKAHGGDHDTGLGGVGRDAGGAGGTPRSCSPPPCG